MTETATATAAAPTIPANAKIVDMLDWAVPVLTHASTVEPDQRAQVDEAALRAFARHMVNKWDGDALDVSSAPQRYSLPVYASGNKGVGSVRYTKQRAALLIALAHANACAADLAYTKYTYPNPNTGRRNYHVNLFGARVDVSRTLAMFKVLELRAIKDAYNSGILPIPEGTRPADQTKIRREWFVAQVEEVAHRVETIFDQVAQERKADGQLSDRQTAAQAARDAFMAEESAKGEAGEQTESTNE